MLEHLVHAEPAASSPEPEITDPGDFTPLDRAGVDDILSAKVKTADWLAELGAPDTSTLVQDLEKDAARQAFTALALSPDENSPEQKAALAQLKTPAAVRHLTGMLSAYDWEFIEQAKELRGYTVAQLVELSQDRNPNIRLKALGLLGKVTEVGLFTEKVEIKKTDFTDAELEQRIKDKLNRFMGVVDVVDVAQSADEDLQPVEIDPADGQKDQNDTDSVPDTPNAG